MLHRDVSPQGEEVRRLPAPSLSSFSAARGALPVAGAVLPSRRAMKPDSLLGLAALAIIRGAHLVFVDACTENIGLHDGDEQ